MKKIFIFIVGVIFSLNILAQNNKKYDVGLINLEHQNSTQGLKERKANEILDVFISGNIQEIVKIVEENGGDIGTTTSKLATARIPLKSLDKISQSEFVEKVQLSRPVKSYRNQAAKHIGADKVKQGTSGLTQAYNGKNVVIGIIDSGIDYFHEDFRDKNDPSKSKILYLWDQNDRTGTNPSNFKFGSEWTKSQLEEAIKNNGSGIAQKDEESGHGTHVSGIATGNKGMAPEANIVFVALNFMNSTGIADAASYIFKKADELGLPCVINASVGGHFNPHDGTEAEEVMIEEMLQQKPGRAFVAAAGNEGDSFIHFQANLDDEEMYTWYYGAFIKNFFKTRIYGIIDKSEVENIEIATAMDSTTLDKNNILRPVKKIKTSKYTKISDFLDKGVKIFNFKYGDGTKTGTVMFMASTSMVNKEKVELLIQIDEPFNIKLADKNSGLNLYRIIFKGTGNVHLWELTGKSLHSLETISVTPDKGFVSTNNKYTVGSPATGNSIISVGAYTNRTSWPVTLNSNAVINNPDIKVGKIADFSSMGPTLDKRIKPEITAPGHYVASSLSHWYKLTANDENMVLYGDKEWVMSGTSMACPVVTGAIALMLEQNPKMPINEIRKILFDNTDKDSFTGNANNLPNNIWGYGKLNILKAMLANTSTGFSEIVSNNKNILIKSTYPNPFSNSITISLANTNNEEGSVQIIDILGNIVYSQKIKSGQDQFVWDSDRKSAGVYFCKILLGNKTETVKIVQK
ncbi:MAG: S8/S53 family peptidase [Bacteroidales bacterium]